MGMMQYMRGTVTKIVLYLLVFAFLGTIIFEWGMDVTGLRSQASTGVIAEINGEEISINDFSQRYQAALENFRQRTGSEIADAQSDFILNQVWEETVRTTLERQTIHALNLSTSKDEIWHYLRDDPPDFIKNMDSSFTTPTGQLNHAVYAQALRNPQNEPIWLDIENFMRQNLPVQKLHERIGATVFVTQSEIHQEYINRNQTATVEYVFFDPNRFNDVEVEIDENKVRDYYAKNKESYHQPERRKIDYVIFSTRATKRDSIAIEEKALELLERARSGDDFAELAAINSDDELSAANGGELGFNKRDGWVKAFSDAAFGAEVDSIVGPVRSTFGLHIIKVTGRKTEDEEEMVSASHILLKFQASEQTKTTALDSADYLAATSREKGWSATVESENLRPLTTAYFQEGAGFIPGLGIQRNISRFTFRNDVNSISDPIETENGYVVIRVSEVDKERTKSLDEVRNIIENTLKREERKALAGEQARKIKQAIDNGATLETAVANDSLSIQKLDPFSRNDNVPGIGRDPAFTGAAFALVANQVSEPVEGIRGYYLIRLLEKSSIDDADFANQKESIRAELKARKEQQAYSQWYAQVKENADIKDYRKSFY